MAERFYNTKEAGRILRVQPTRLQQAIWNGRIDAPAKSPSGNFLWTERDLERASWQLLKRPLAARGEGAEHV